MVLPDDYQAFLEQFHSPKFVTLWPAQLNVLASYAANYSDVSDVAVELPTGKGKTLIALLIAEAWRQRGHKVAILSANKTLARQMNGEALALGIPATLMEGAGRDIPSTERRRYQRAQCIAVMNYWVYINQNPVIDPADLLIMDDAHLAEHCLHSLYSVEVTRSAHPDLFAGIVADLAGRFAEYSVLHDAREQDSQFSSPPELLSFIDQVAFAPRLRELIEASPYINTDDDLRFRWDRMRNRVKASNIYLSVSSIWIRPYIYPFSSNTYYSQACQRLYMSATIGEPADLARRLGTRTIQKIPVPQIMADATSGRRMIVMNRIEDKDIPERLEHAILTGLRLHPKTVWMCTSKSAATKFSDIVPQWLSHNGITGHPTWTLTSLGDEIDAFKSSAVGHLFVAGRFDGMDFSGEQCRIVVLTTIPHAINIQEEFVSAYLRDASFMKHRLNQRIIQALGRCNRSGGDYAMYVLADRRFATHFGRESQRRGLPANIVAEIDFAEDMAEVPIEQLTDAVGKFLAGDFADYDASLAERLDDARAVGDPNADEVLASIADDEVVGWAALFWSQNYEVAAEKFERCRSVAVDANIIELGAYYGWCKAKAQYLSGDRGNTQMRGESLNTLREAIDRGGRTSWFNTMKASLARAVDARDGYGGSDVEYGMHVCQRFSELLEQVGKRGTRFQNWCNRLFEGLQSEAHDQYAEALKLLGWLIGYDASRPRHGSSTDCQWRGVFGNIRELIVLEAKIGHIDTGRICATHVGQANIQMNRAAEEYARLGYTVRGAIVTHMNECEDDALSGLGPIRIVEKAAVISLWEHVHGLLVEYREVWSADDVSTRIGAANLILDRLPQAGWLCRSVGADEPFIGPDALCAEW